MKVKNIKEGNAYLKQLCEQKGIKTPQPEYNLRALNNLIEMVESANTKSGTPVTHFHSNEKHTAAPTLKTVATQFSEKKAPLQLKAESYDEQNARFRATRENSPEANGLWIRSMVAAGTVSEPTNFAEAITDLQTLGCSKAEAIQTCVFAYPALHAGWLESGATSHL